MFKDRKALVTGGSSGIGLALAEQMARRGAHLWLLARNRDRLDQAAKRVQGVRSDGAHRVETLSVDVADADAVADAMRSLQAAEGTPDLLVNSAGVVQPGFAEDLRIDDFHQMMDVNYFGTVHVTQSLLSGMLARGSGHIVNISSMAGFMGVIGYTAYSASKFAVRGYSDTLRAELKGSGVDVSISYPPDTKTPQLEYETRYRPAETEAFVGDREPVSPESVAESIVEGVQRGRYVIIPHFEGRFFYWLSGALGMALYPVMDFYVAQARRQVARGQ